MQIKDIDGKTIEITDLPNAIKQADLFKGFQHQEQTAQQKIADEHLKRYWTDIHSKLLQLQSKTKN